MTMKKRDNLIAVAFLAFILILPAVTLVRGFLPQEDTVVSQEQQDALLNANGTMQDGAHGAGTTQETQPAPEAELPWFTGLQNTLNEFTNRLFTRTKLIALNTELTKLLTGGTYIESTQVLLGKNDWLFYKTEIDGHPIWDYMGINHFTEEELAAMAANLTQMRDYFEERGIDFFITALPNKEVVYEENMPDTIARVNEVSRSEQVAEYMWANTDLKYIYPKQQLLEAKEDYQIYYETDTHWNQIGAFIGMQEIFKEAYGTHAEADSVSFRVDSETFAGDLATIAGVTADYSNDTVYVFEAESADEAQYRDEVCFVVGDSFSGFLSTIAKGYYKEVHWIYATDFTMDMVEELQPDVIIWETVERYMETFQNVNLLTK